VSRKKGQPDDNAVSDLSRGPPETLRAAGDLFFFFFGPSRDLISSLEVKESAFSRPQRLCCFFFIAMSFLSPRFFKRVI